MVTHLIANQRLLVKGYARSSRASVAYVVAEKVDAMGKTDKGRTAIRLAVLLNHTKAIY